MSSSSPKTWALTHGHTHTGRANKGDEPKHWRKIDEVVSVWLLTLKAMWIRANMLLFSFKHNGWMYFNGNGSRWQHSKPLIFVWQTLCLVTTCFVCAIHASFDGPFFLLLFQFFSVFLPFLITYPWWNKYTKQAFSTIHYSSAHRNRIIQNLFGRV